MKTEKATIKAETLISEDGKFYYLKRKEWDKSKNTATVLSISPSSQSNVCCDLTSQLIQNNLYRLGFGGFELVNLIAAVDVAAKKLKGLDGLIGEENDKHILESVKRTDLTVLAYGKIATTNKVFTARENEVLELLKEHLPKLHFITDITAREMLQPLTPSIRNGWILQPYSLPDKKEDRQEDQKAS